MAFTEAQLARVNAAQTLAGTDPHDNVRLLAGPGTGKSKTISIRIMYLLQNGVEPENIYVVSFTRATCSDLKRRILNDAEPTPYIQGARRVAISTLHSLALSILRRANLLNRYPSTPVILDKWEQKYIFDSEFCQFHGCTMTKAGELREAFSAHWETLNPLDYDRELITEFDINAFLHYLDNRTSFYSCVLPDEIIFRCVDNYRNGQITHGNTRRIDHLIVDEYQDLNSCDQEFIRYLCGNNTKLYVAGDDDQSIYSFRYANPEGMINFGDRYPNSVSHQLHDCFRCTSSIIGVASSLISYNLIRQEKTIISMYSQSDPVNPGILHGWKFDTLDQEATAIAQSCHALIEHGMTGAEDQIMVLISRRDLQLAALARAFEIAGLRYEAPDGSDMRDKNSIRALYALLRLIRENDEHKDYPAYRDLCGVLDGVGSDTISSIVDLCLRNQYNYRLLYRADRIPEWITGRARTAIIRIRNIIDGIEEMEMTDMLIERRANICALLSENVFTNVNRQTEAMQAISSALDELPEQILLEELYQFLAASDESEQNAILNQVVTRVGDNVAGPATAIPKCIRIMTMHGAKGLDAKVVFIPGIAQEIMPGIRALQATGLIEERRRLLYVSLTRAKACCIISYSTSVGYGERHQLRGNMNLTPSVFHNQMGLVFNHRRQGLHQDETETIIGLVNSL